MTSKIVIGGDGPEFAVNVVPCSIHYTGDANTATFFKPSKKQINQGDNHVVTAQFRGLKLVGDQIDISNKNGQILTSSEILVNDPSKSDGDISIVKQYSAIGNFRELNVYGHDNPLSQNSKWKMLDEWEKIAEAIHS